MYERLLLDAINAFGLEYARIYSVQKGYRNEIYPIQLTNGSMVQLTFYKSEEGMEGRIRRADEVSLYVFEKGLPARTRADRRTLTFTSKKRIVYVGLYHYLPGQTIPWEAYTKQHIKQLGKTMSDMHLALKDFDTTLQSSVIDETSALIARMDRYFQDQSVGAAMKEKLSLLPVHSLKKYNAAMEKMRSLPAQQLHMDFVRGNVLFQGDELVGILDFEKTAFGPVLFDVARTLAFLLVDCKHKTEEQVRSYFLQSGYTKRGGASLPYYPNALELLIDLYLIHDFYKFLEHTPYEALKDNEHFTRTLSVLTHRAVLHYI